MFYKTQLTSNASKRKEKQKKITLVCVTDQRKCERIIRASRLVADVTDTQLCVINVSNPDPTKQDYESLEYLFEISKQNQAPMNIFYSEQPLKMLSAFIKEQKVANVITGIPQASGSILEQLWQKFKSINFYVVDPMGALCEVDRLALCLRPDAISVLQQIVSHS